MPVVWIVDDQDEERQRAKQEVQKAFHDAHLSLQIVEWDGGQLPKTHPEADFVILDLNLENHGSGLECIQKLPGVQPDRMYGPFIIIWTHFDGEYPIASFLKAHTSDRIVRTHWKSQTTLEESLKGFVRRFIDEGVYHGERNT